MALKELTTQDEIRLDDIAKNLKVKSRYGDSTFTEDVVAAAVARVKPIVQKLLPCSGEDIALGLGESLRVRFEEVHGRHDIDKLHDHYVKGKRELGFAQLYTEFDNPEVDAVLIQRVHAREGDPDGWVAVLNLQDSAARAYWNRFHELSHRIAEPPQKILPLYRHKTDLTNPVELLIDAITAELAFYGPVFRPLVASYAKKYRLSMAVVDAIRKQYAPTASLLATMNAVVKHWPRPAAALTAEFRGRKGKPNVDRALRLSQQYCNDVADVAGLTFFPNMRVPATSPMQQTFVSGLDQQADERLGDWTTSQGKRLTPMNVFTSARKINQRVYAVISI